MLGGLAIVVGAFVEIVSVPLIVMMLVAMFTVHLKYGFSSVNPIVLMELNPYFKCTVNIATSIMTISGTLTISTNAPTTIARPPSISMNSATQAAASGSGQPIW